MRALAFVLLTLTVVLTSGVSTDDNVADAA